MTPPADTAEIAPSIHQAMALVMKDIGAVDKGGFNSQQNYKFRGIDQFMTAAHPALVAHGVYVCPEVLGVESNERATKSGGLTTHRLMTVRYTFYGPAGDSVSCTTVGESADSYDKASNKCLAAAYKYALMQVFCIPLESEKDADATSPDMGQLGTSAPASNGEALRTEQQTKQFIALAEAGGLDRADRKAIVLADTGRQFWKDVTATEADELIGKLQANGFELAQEGSGRWIAYKAGQEPFELDGGTDVGSGDAPTREDGDGQAAVTSPEPAPPPATVPESEHVTKVKESLEQQVERAKTARASGPSPTHRQTPDA